MQEIRCGQCNKKLAEAVFIQLNIKCPRCGTLNRLSAGSALQEHPLSVDSRMTQNGRNVPANPISADRSKTD
ncbi:Com family DNA-binding transcriptional regulator [Nitrosomonas oligotropha]|uniref:Com family DNA-binding transcriptional regulator n=1 Tax=Nitrosomonas oligotropha TaxID=42354 RepID=UPI000B7E129B|nr:Com family DNA-binding transcriptional regulator [Nitrosomonas oligotropha]